MALQLLLLLLLTVTSECLTVGEKFVAVFPENIAYYHPSPPQNLLRVTALHDDTHVNVSNGLRINPQQDDLQSGQSRTFNINASLELSKMDLTSKVVSIESNNPISVEILSRKNNSVQTALLLPMERLGKEYQVPPIPEIQRTTMPENNVTDEVTERSYFKLILVNGDNYNTIRVPDSTDLNLKPKQVTQVSVGRSMASKIVSGAEPFLALFGHTCAVVFDCTCALLYTPLEPKTPNISTFIVPSGLSEGVDTTYLLKASNGEKEKLSSISKVMFEDQGPVVLQRPGLLLNLIPEEEFGSCFAVHNVQNAKNWAIVMAPTDTKKNVWMNKDPVTSPWTEVSSTNFSWTKINLDQSREKHIFWHNSSLMAVWFLGGNDTVVKFGNPAARLSKTPDYRGCVVEPEQLEVLEQRSSWQKSIQACRDNKLELISLKDQNLQKHIHDLLQNHKDNLTDVWMGLRRSSYSGKWYWISEEPLVHVDWAPGSPGSEDEGPCAQISLKDPQDPKWTHQDCCSKARPVCYRPPKLLNLD